LKTNTKSINYLNQNNDKQILESKSSITFEPIINNSNSINITKKSTKNIPMQTPPQNSMTILNDIITNPGNNSSAKEQ
jgi:hypothetical protein